MKPHTAAAVLAWFDSLLQLLTHLHERASHHSDKLPPALWRAAADELAGVVLLIGDKSLADVDWPAFYAALNAWEQKHTDVYCRLLVEDRDFFVHARAAELRALLDLPLVDTGAVCR